MMRPTNVSLPSRILRRYVVAARSGAGSAMLLVTLLLSVWIWLDQDGARALISGSLLYGCLITCLVIGRK